MTLKGGNVLNIIIMAGVAGSGKSQHADKLMSELKGDTVLLSSDTYRLKMFGSLKVGNERANSRKVTTALHNDLIDVIKSGEFDTVILDAVNLSRKRRRSLYRRIKDISSEDVNVKIIFFSLPLQNITIQNNFRDGEKVVPDSVIHDMYLQLQVPRVGVDCDSFEVLGFKMFDTLPEYGVFNTIAQQFIKSGRLGMSQELKRLTEGHDCAPHHLESIETHIEMCSLSAFLLNDRNLFNVAMFHDLGKSISKKMVTKDGTTKAIYRGHANVSANYYLNYQVFTAKTFDNRQRMILEAIYQHMIAHQGLSHKNIRNNKLDDETLKLIERFREIDEISRIEDVSSKTREGREQL